MDVAEVTELVERIARNTTEGLLLPDEGTGLPVALDEIQRAEADLGFEWPEDFRSLLQVSGNMSLYPCFECACPPASQRRQQQFFVDVLVAERLELSSDDSPTRLLGDLDRLLLVSGTDAGTLYAFTEDGWRLRFYHVEQDQFIVPYFPSIGHRLRCWADLSDAGLLTVHPDGFAVYPGWQRPWPSEVKDIYYANGYEGPESMLV